MRLGPSDARRSRARAAAAWAVCVALGLCASGAHGQGPSGGGGPPAGNAAPPPANVVVEAARIEPLERTREVTGQLRVGRRSVLASEGVGLVVTMDVEPGDTIDRGQVVARLDSAQARLAVGRALAAVAVRRAVLAERSADRDRAGAELARFDSAGESVAPLELENRRALLAIADAQVMAAEADVGTAIADLDEARRREQKLVIAAPFRGRVVSRRTDIGQWIREGDPVVEVVDLESVEAVLDVPESLIARIDAPGAIVRVVIGGIGAEIDAAVTAIVPDADPLARLFPVRVRLPNPEGRLRPGMSASGLIPTGRFEPVLTVSRDAIRRDDSGEYVFVERGGVALPARVRRVDAWGGRVAVEPAGTARLGAAQGPDAGASVTIAQGAMVIVEGNERVTAGAPVKSTVRQATPAEPRPGAAPARAGTAEGLRRAG
ncbi:MAG: hypothetical protein C0513_00685 [Isosphaera sp.]|nr:hypothetical protein [Isosphaera sp.]